MSPRRHPAGPDPTHERATSQIAVYRAPMRARRRPDIPAGAGARLAVGRGLVGMGGRLEASPTGIAAAIAATAAQDPDGERAARRLARFAALPVGTFVWTTDVDGTFRVGRILGEWDYVDAAPLDAVGLHHVRPTEWDAEPLQPDAVPPGVVTAFARGGLNFQRIRDAGAERQTAELWRGGRR